MNRIPVFKTLFILAGFYNVVFAVWFWIDYRSLFDLSGVSLPFSAAWVKPLAIGIILFAPGYFYAAWKPDKAFYGIAFGFLAKVTPPFLVMALILFADWPSGMMKMMFFNDIIWWIPFFLFLKKYRLNRDYAD